MQLVNCSTGQAEGMKALAMQRAQEAKMVDLKVPKIVPPHVKLGVLGPNGLNGAVVQIV